MKGIILAGGKGQRLYPLTKTYSKQLLPVYDKPMIYYPLSVLMLSEVRDILIITNESDLTDYKNLLGDGSDLGISLTYKIQAKPNGIPEALTLSQEFIGNDNVCLILGDNIFYGEGLPNKLIQLKNFNKGAHIFCQYVTGPESYGICEFDENYNILSLEEKPERPKSNFAVTGLYFFDNTVIEKSKSLKPSSRGELEITDLLNLYLSDSNLDPNILGRGIAWFDAGTPDSLLKSSNFVQAIEERQGLKVACLEEIALNKKYITKDHLSELVNNLPPSSYQKYLKDLL